MRTIKFITLAAAALAMAACTGNEPKIETENQLPTKAETDSVSYLIGVNFGYFIKYNNFGEDLNKSMIDKGMKDFMEAEGQPNSPEFNEQFQISPEEMNRIFNEYISKINKHTAEVNKIKGEKFLEENKMKDGIEVTESGLQYRIIEAGNDVKAGPEDAVFVHYTGTLIDGTEFDATDKEKEPIKMVLNRVIKGWTEGLQLVGEGGHIELYVPAELGYGERNMGNIGPNSTLIFDVTVEKVEKKEAPKEETK